MVYYGDANFLKGRVCLNFYDCNVIGPPKYRSMSIYDRFQTLECECKLVFHI